MQTVSALAHAFYAFMEGRNKPGTIGYYRRHIDRFLAHVGPMPIADVRKHHLLTWGKTWHAMQAVQRLFHWGHVDMELIDRNPFKGIKRPRLGMRKRVLVDADAVKLLRGADVVFRRYLHAMRESIARPQEIRAVKWDHLRWDGEHAGLVPALLAGAAYFEIWEYKSQEQRADPDTPRIIYINVSLGRMLVNLAGRRASPAGHIFTNAAGRPWTSNAIRLRMRRLCRRLGIVEDGRGERVVAYTLRHTSATNATADGVPDRVLADLMGHTSTRTTARYQHLSKVHLRNAVNRNQKPH